MLSLPEWRGEGCPGLMGSRRPASPPGAWSRSESWGSLKFPLYPRFHCRGQRDWVTTRPGVAPIQGVTVRVGPALGRRPLNRTANLENRFLHPGRAGGRLCELTTASCLGCCRLEPWRYCGHQKMVGVLEGMCGPRTKPGRLCLVGRGL